MKKILVAFCLLGLFSGQIHAQKRKTKAKARVTRTTKKTKVKANSKTANVDEIPAIPINEMADVAPASTTSSQKTSQVEVPAEPTASMSILNAKSPEAYRQARRAGLVKKGDELISVKVKPLDYGYVEDKDVLRSMVVWEIIDLNQRLNQPFYYNADNLANSNKSLYQILLDGINDGRIKEVYNDEMFEMKLGKEEINKRLFNQKESDWLIEKRNNGDKITEEDLIAGTDKFEVKSENIKMIKIKGMWYIDRRDGQMKYRPIGIAAVGQDPSTLGQTFADKNELIDLFWIYYPDAREVLANNIVFNRNNLSSDINYDDLINMRRFSSVIYRSETGQGNGVIRDYIPNSAEEQLEESDRIKEQILEMENDMWNP